MTQHRYLMYFSYIGTKFRGYQKQFNKGIPIYEQETVQSVIENAFLTISTKYKCVNVPKLYATSRTDQGVHALCTGAHVDLELQNGATNNSIIKYLNSYLNRNNFEIRVLSLNKVPETFSARYSAIRKKYLYRLAFLKSNDYQKTKYNRSIVPYPILEKNRCLFIRNPDFDLEIFKNGSKLFLGWNDFTTFMHRSAFKKDLDPKRHIESIELSPGRPFIDCQESNCYNYIDVTFVGRSFLYKQVRRMVGVLIAAAVGRITISDIEFMLKNPSPKSWNEKVEVSPGYALYLLNVEYNTSDLIFKE